MISALPLFSRKQMGKPPSKSSALDTLFRSPQDKKRNKKHAIGLSPTRISDLDLTKTCPYCGRPMDRNGPPELRPTRDHFLPRSRGHHLVPHNKVICCQDCNGKKRDRGVLEWLVELRRSRNPLDRIRCVRLNHFIEHRQRHGLPVDDSETVTAQSVDTIGTFA